jgi:hypothetical protein
VLWQDSGASALCRTGEGAALNAPSHKRRFISITVRPSPWEKQCFVELARLRGVTEGQLALQAVRTCLDLGHIVSGTPVTPPPITRTPSTDRVTIRLRPGDLANIQWRARERGELPSAYIAALVRAHIAAAPPLVRDEMQALKACASALASALHLLRRVRSTPATQGDRDLRGALTEMEGAVRNLEQDTRAFIEKALATWEAHIRD